MITRLSRNIFLSAIALLLNCSIFSMNFKPMRPKSPKPKQLRLSFEEAPALPESENNSDEIGSRKFEAYKNGFKNIAQLEFALTCAPSIIHEIIANLEDPNFDKTQVKKQIALVGPTGCGKSIMARAIAHKLKRDYYFVPAVFLLSHYRHGTARNYQKLFQKLEDCKPSPVFILDEVSVVGGGRIQRDADDTEIIETLCTFIDKQRNNQDFLMIVNTIDPDDIPTQLRERCQVVRMYNW